ncbi:hypothetical protein NDU88_003446 [Pleurodeles waltl]|uniref:Uncharacterized protein n=1 Tax=Pleurodeles waltl TaxID=8319 RepID=A0AAV7W519_PLEWA|nr:hypothetical protein NDU88_003446 [Pleurodeles waltl]
MQPPSQPLKRHLAPGLLQQSPSSCSSTPVPPALSRQQSRDAPPVPRAKGRPKPAPPSPAAAWAPTSLKPGMCGSTATRDDTSSQGSAVSATPTGEMQD